MSSFETLIFHINDLNLAYQRLIVIYNQLGKQLHLSAGNIMVLSCIEELAEQSDGPVTIKQLHHFIGGSRTNLSPRITLLLDRGYVVENPNDLDRRTMVIELTDQGNAVLQQATHYFEQSPIEGQQVVQNLLKDIKQHS